MNPTNKYINKFIDEIVNGDVVEANDVKVMIDNEETKEEEKEDKKTDPTDTNNSNEEEDKKKFLNEIKKNIHQNEYNNNDELYKHCFQDISVEEYKKPKKPKDPKDPKDSKEKNERCILDQVEGTELQEYNNLLDYHTKHKIKTIFNIGDDLNEIPKEKIKIIIKNMSEGFKEIIDYINSNILKPDKRLHLYECINILKIRLRNKDTLLNSLKFENEGHNKENYNFIKQQILNIINDEIERVNNKRKIDEDKVIDIKEKNIDSFISKFNEQYTGKAYLRDNEKIVLKIKNIEKNSIVKTHACFNEIDINIPDKKITSKKKILERFKKQLSFEPGFLDSLKMSLLDNSNYNMA